MTGCMDAAHPDETYRSGNTREKEMGSMASNIRHMTGAGSQNFVITVKKNENHTWQGTVTWVEGHREENFRSALELIKLMDSVISEEEVSLITKQVGHYA